MLSLFYQVPQFVIPLKRTGGGHFLGRSAVLGALEGREAGDLQEQTQGYPQVETKGRNILFPQTVSSVALGQGHSLLEKGEV